MYNQMNLNTPYVLSPQPPYLTDTLPLSTSCVASSKMVERKSFIWVTIIGKRHCENSHPEDAQAIAISSYQGGHVEFFPAWWIYQGKQRQPHQSIWRRRRCDCTREIRKLHAHGVIPYSPEDGRKMGLEGMISHLLQASDYSVLENPPSLEDIKGQTWTPVRCISTCH